MRKFARIIAAVLLTVSTALLLESDPTSITAQGSRQGFVASAWAAEPESTRSSPKDDTLYSRPAVPEDWALGAGSALGAEGVSPPAVFIVDPAVLAGTGGGTEPSIAVDPANPDHIVIHAGFGGWNGNASVWDSTDGGVTWTLQSSIPAPPGGVGTAGCPCDTVIDYGRSNLMSGTFLATPIYTGTTSNPASAAAWNWNTPGGVTQTTNINNSPAPGGVDQPWLVVTRDPATAAQDNVYVGYDDFTNGLNCVGDACDMRVSVSGGANPPNFTADNQSGTATGNVNPGHRLAADPRTGFVYSAFQRNIAAGGGGSKNIDYMLNRSADGGATWTLNASATGIVVANADSTQPTPKFGTVNALLGGVDHIAVDPTTGDVYYAYGNRDGVTGNNRLAIRRLTSDGAGGLTVGAENFVTGQVQAAIPSVAVKDDGTVGVFYYTFDGFSSDNFPVFTAHLALSGDKGVTFTDIQLLTFLSAATDNSNARQRVLGDYVQLKAVGNCLHGVFTGNGVSFGQPVAQHDPIYYRVCEGPDARVQGTLEFGLVAVNPVGGEAGFKDLEFEVLNVGNENLSVNSVTCFAGDCTDFTVLPDPATPLFVSPDAHVSFLVRFNPTVAGPRSATIRVATNDPDQPTFDLAANGTGAVPDIRVSGSTGFGDVCGGTSAEKEISICNNGASNLNVTSVAFNPACADFTIVNNPFPAIVSPDFCTPLTIRFTPTSSGPKSCTLVINSNDPDTPIVSKTVTADTPVASIDVPPNQSFLPEVIQSAGVCTTLKPFPISNTGACNLSITNVSIGGTNAGDFGLSGLPSFPIILEPGHIAGEGNLKTVFAPTALDRDRLGTLSVTYVSDAITGATAQVTRDLCGEGVLTGARVLVRAGGVPLSMVEKIQLQRINANRNKNQLDTNDVARNLSLQTVTPGGACAPFQFHREYGTVANPIQLLPGSYQVTATAIVNGKRQSKSVGFDVSTCDFNPTVVVDF